MEGVVIGLEPETASADLHLLVEDDRWTGLCEETRRLRLHCSVDVLLVKVIAANAERNLKVYRDRFAN